MNELIDSLREGVAALENANSFAPCPMYAEALAKLKTQLALLLGGAQ